MSVCTSCGTKNENTALFCANCGSSMKNTDPKSTNLTPPPQSFDDASVGKSQNYNYQGQLPPQYPQSQGYNQYGYSPDFKPPRTSWLTLVIVLESISVVFLVVGGLFLFAFSDRFGDEGSFLQGIAIILFILAALIIWLIKELNEYNNTARVIAIVLAVLGILTGFASFNPLNIVFSGLILYALGFEQETIALFKPEQRFNRLGSP